ncbi:hypothetical protein WH43_12160 [Rheinheimera sp. KL1]|nr:hypothetical protein WH43_12160 [Rheinheimera sp. KL1]
MKNIPDVFFPFVLDAAALLAALLAPVILKILTRHDMRVLASIQMHIGQLCSWGLARLPPSGNINYFEEYLRKKAHKAPLFT